jgi:predicted nucleic acid-binding Zn ribbon protein
MSSKKIKIVARASWVSILLTQKSHSCICFSQRDFSYQICTFICSKIINYLRRRNTGYKNCYKSWIQWMLIIIQWTVSSWSCSTRANMRKHIFLAWLDMSSCCNNFWFSFYFICILRRNLFLLTTRQFGRDLPVFLLDTLTCKDQNQVHIWDKWSSFPYIYNSSFYDMEPAKRMC